MISLCIISRKEDSKSLRNLIKSCIEYVDEICILDTGKENLLPAGNDKGEILHHPKVFVARTTPAWTESFADARNNSFKLSSPKSTVIFCVDSDDIVLHPENIPKLAEKIEKGEVDWIYSEYIYQKDETGNVIAKHWKPRMFRKGTGHWVGNVHEDFMPDQVVIQKQDRDLGVTIQIEHQATQDELEEHSKRNLVIQLAELRKDKEKTDPRTIQYIAMSMQGLGRWELAVQYFLEHVKITGSKEDKFWSLYRASTCLHILRRNDEALNLALDSLKLFPQWKSSYFLLASIYHELEDWTKVIEWTLTGLEKSDPDTLQVISELDYTILPLARLTMAYLQTGNYQLANETAIDVYRMNPEFPGSKDLVKMCMDAIKSEGFVKSFLEVVQNIKKYDRVKATKLFDLIPKELDEDRRIQAAHSLIVAPKVWKKKSIVIYCGRSLDEWSYPSVFTGIGGSEKAVIYMAKELTTLGYAVTVYNRCGDMKGVYDGVEYLPYYFFNKKDHFDTLIVWRNPLVFGGESFNAKRRYLWLHDIAHPSHFNKKIYDNIDKIFFLSKWHRTNLPECPEDKVFITNNGINPKDFENLPAKRPNSLIWSSSYDRGLLPFIKNILPLIKKEKPDVTLDVAYGWNNIEKEMELIPELKKLYTELSPILENTPGITHHGRISHKKLAELMGSSLVYPYASEFGETCNITSMECQAARCYVVTTQQAGATPERIKFGHLVEKDNIYTDKEAQKIFAKWVVMNLHNPSERTFDVSDFYWSTTAKKWQKEVL